MDPQDVFVGNLAGQQQFLFEALHRLGISHQIWADQLERNRPIELLVVCLVYRAHASLAEPRLNAVARAELRARLQSEKIAGSGAPGSLGGGNSAGPDRGLEAVIGQAQDSPASLAPGGAIGVFSMAMRTVHERTPSRANRRDSRICP